MGAATIPESQDVPAQSELDARVESLLAAHNGDPLAVIETLLLAVDVRAERVSFGFVRGRLPAIERREH